MSTSALPRRLLLALLGLLLLASPAGAADAADTYVVLTGFATSDPYHEAAVKLAKHHGTKHLLRFDPEAPAAILDELRALEPTHVAIVLRPEQIHVNSVRRILKMATKLDDDPFVDFSFGYITAATPKEAVGFVENIVKASKRELPRKVGQSAVWGGQGDSVAADETYVIGSLSFPSRRLRFRSPDAGHGRNQAFIDKELKSLEGCGAIIMGGHGGPAEIVSGPRTEDIDKLDLFPAIAVNYACYTGVTNVYPERSFGGGKITNHLKEVEAKRSFALAMIRRGAVGYVAYVNPRPAGPEMTTDFQRILTGSSLGEVRRNDYAKIALGYLGFGEVGIVPPDVEDGEQKARTEVDSVRHMMLDASTGGILYGDPAYCPYPVVDDVLPLTSLTEQKGEELEITLGLRGQEAYLWGADPFRRFTEQPPTMAMKMYDRILVPDDFGPVRSVRVESATWGGQAIETLPVVWAEEKDHGRRYLHVKAGFARGGRGDIQVRLVAGPKELPPQVREKKAKAAEPLGLVGRLNQALRQGGQLSAEDRAALQRLGKDGFDAVLREIREGRAHYRTHELIRATKSPGDESALIALAEGPDLPSYGKWIVLESLGYFDTPEVRSWLLARLETDRGAGRFMSAAKALAMLREARGVEPIAEQLFRFEKSWRGVEWHLVHALGGIGGEAAVAHLVTFVGDDRATQGVGVSYALDHLARLDAAAAKKAAKALVETERFQAFSERARTHIAQYAN